MLKYVLPSLVACLASLQLALAQGAAPNTPITGQDDSISNPIITSVPFLTIAPDARSAGMGDVGAATAPDVNSLHWNAAKMPFIEQKMGASVSITPWLRRIVDDMVLSYLSGYRKISNNEVVGVSMRYFDLGSMDFTNINKELIQTVNPRELAFDVTYARKLSKSFSMGIAGRYIHSNLTGNLTSGNNSNNLRPANSVAVDISSYYTKDDMVISGYDSKLSFGAVLSNIGPKITYSDNSQRDFIPTNLRLGGAVTTEFDPYNKLTFALDFNKLMVPTPPRRNPDGTLQNPSDTTQSGWVVGMFRSFGDAPGGFTEEMREIAISTGLEYWYNDKVAVRGGYFYENRFKGYRQYLTAGVGLKFQIFAIDFAYLISTRQNNPLDGSIRFSLLFNFKGKADETKFESSE